MMSDMMMSETASAFDVDGKTPFNIVGDATLPSFFDVTPLAAMSIGTAGDKLAALARNDGEEPPAVTVDQRLASLWFQKSIRPTGWDLAPTWDSVAGDYRTKDGWIRLHTNAPHHRARALKVLGVGEDRDAVTRAVETWEADALENAIVEARGCAAVMRSIEDWAKHPQGAAVAAEKLVIWDQHGEVGTTPLSPRGQRPLADLKVLDCTRVLAGPAASRFLAAFGADVLRIDPPDWDEALAVQEMTLGKRCARLDLRLANDRTQFEKLLASADVMVHGYRADALSGLGYGREERQALNPGLIDVSLNAYGWSGPWSTRRGFDSLVQMSAGIADFGMKQKGADRPFPLPVQALDHATGYFMAAAVLHALEKRRGEGRVLSARLSLARTAHLLAKTRRDQLSEGLPETTDSDLDPWREETAWGPARRLRFPIEIEGVKPSWPYPAGALGSSAPVWTDAG